ncbi:MAG: type II toxin-antitoxin system prevent-host-death family antitoxin [Actinomycetota bacterium]
MRTVSVSELKAHLSKYLQEVRRGGEVQVLDRGVPVARLSGLAATQAGAGEDHRQRLIRSGLLRSSTAPMSIVLGRPPLPSGGDIGGALDEDRSDRL